VFGRRHRSAADDARGEAAEDALLEDEMAEDELLPGEDSLPGDAVEPEVDDEGPWDAADPYPEYERVDLGSLRIPAAPGMEVQVNVADDRIVAATVVRGDSALQLHAFAAPKRSGLWDDVRQELIDELRAAGGTGHEADGPFGLEVVAQVPVGDPAQPGTTQPVRFLGVDGPRWFLRGVISGSAALRPELAHPLEDVFADVVVVRGDHPAPPRDMLELRLPAEAEEALGQQAGENSADAEGGGGRPPLELFQRGPEITETQ
jgi:Protein of unknown function (DUF3710)